MLPALVGFWDCVVLLCSTVFLWLVMLVRDVVVVFTFVVAVLLFILLVVLTLGKTSCCYFKKNIARVLYYCFQCELFYYC